MATKSAKRPCPAPFTNSPWANTNSRSRPRGYVPFERTVEVRFQKSTRVVVRLASNQSESSKPVTTVGAPTVRKRPAPNRWYSSRWFYIGVGVTAAVLGGMVGYQLARNQEINCQAEPERCRSR